MKQLDLILLWHMHQPDYRDYTTNEFVLHVGVSTCHQGLYRYGLSTVEMHPQTKAIINFVPVLLINWEDYIEQFSVGQMP